MGGFNYMTKLTCTAEHFSPLMFVRSQQSKILSEVMIYII